MHFMFWPRRSYAKQTHRNAKKLFFILEPSKLYANLKKTTQRRLVERESSIFRNQLPFVQACSSVWSFSLSFWCLPFTTF